MARRMARGFAKTPDPIIGAIVQKAAGLPYNQLTGAAYRCTAMDIRAIQQRIRVFRDKRNWMQFHNPKNLVISISIEAAELLEHFQWKNLEESEKHAKEAKDQIADEVADVAVYLIELCDNFGSVERQAMPDMERPLGTVLCMAPGPSDYLSIGNRLSSTGCRAHSPPACR